MSFRLGYYLVKHEKLTVAEVDRATRRQQLLGGSLDTNLLELQLLSLEDLELLLPEALGVSSAEREWLVHPSEEALASLPAPLLQQLQLVPVAIHGDSVHFLRADVGPPAQTATLEYWLGRQAKVYPVLQIRLFQAMQVLLDIPIPRRLLALHKRFPAEGLFLAPTPDTPELSPSFPLPMAETQLYAPGSTAAVSGVLNLQEPEQSAAVLPVRTLSNKKFSLPSTSPVEGAEEGGLTSSVRKETSGLVSTQGLPSPSAILVRKNEQPKRSSSRRRRLDRSLQAGQTGSDSASEKTHPVRRDNLFQKVESGTLDRSAHAIVSAPESEDQVLQASVLNLPSASALRVAFRQEKEPLPVERTRVEEREHVVASPDSSEEAASPESVPLRSKISKRTSALFASEEKTNSDTIFALTEEDAMEDDNNVVEGGGILPYETSYDLSHAVNMIQSAKSEEEKDPKAIFELSELFTPDGQATMPALPAFPSSNEPIDEGDIFPEVTQMDVSHEELGRDLPDDVALKDVSLDEVNQAHKLELDEFLASRDEVARQKLLEGMLRFGASLIPTMLNYVPDSVHVGESNPVLKKRLERLVEICETIGDPALYRMLQLLEKSDKAQNKRILSLLGFWRPPRAIAPLLQRLYSESSPSLQAMICRNLRRYRGQEGFSKMLQFLRENLRSDHPHRLQKALFYLGHLRIIEATVDVIELLHHPQAAIQEYALETLRLLTLQNFKNEPNLWRSWWTRNSRRDRKQWVIEAMSHPQHEVRHRVKEELQLEFGDDFGYEPDATPEERETVRKLATLWIKQS